MLVYHQPLPKQKKRSVAIQCNYFKYMLAKQQIQQMSQLDEENGTVIFYKLKSLFFDENQDDEHIVTTIRQDPIKIVGSMLLELTKAYKQKLQEITDSLEEDKYHLINKLKETRQQLQHSLDDNQFFKATIDRLEEQKKQSEEKLNQSVSQFQRSREDIINEINQRQKIRNQVMKIYFDAQEIFTQNSQLKLKISDYEKQLNLLTEEADKLRIMNEDFCKINQEFTSKYNDSVKNQNSILQEIEDLQNKLNEKDEFIKNMMYEFDKAHFFNSQQSPAAEFTELEKIEDQSNQLKGLSFNNFQKNSNISEKSLSKNSSLCNLDQQIDDKFLHINATAEKVKPKVPINFPCVTEEKINKKGQSKMSSRQKNIYSKNKFASNKVQVNKGPSNVYLNKTLIKTVSSKNFLQKESPYIATPSQGNESKMMEEMLKRKLGEKNQKIVRLQVQVAHLKDTLMEQVQKKTIMEGEYELQIQQLKEQLSYTKKQLANIYQKYTMTNAQCLAYQEKMIELEEELENIQQQHRQYCEELKLRCKAYVLQKINQVQYQYESIKRSLSQRASQESLKTQENIQNSIQIPLQELSQQFHLQFKQRSIQNSKEPSKIDSLSEIQSYQRLDTHYLQGFDLQYSAKLSHVGKNQQEIYIQQQFQIQSNLGMFTQRLIHDKNSIERIKKGNLTDRYNPPFNAFESQQNREAQKHHFSVTSDFIDEKIELEKIKSLKCENVITEKIQYHTLRNNQICQTVSCSFIHSVAECKFQLQYNIQSLSSESKRQKELSFSNSLSLYSYSPEVNFSLSINSKLLEYSFTPNIKFLNFSPVYNQIIEPICKDLKINSNIFYLQTAEKRYSKLQHFRVSNTLLELKKERYFQMSKQINFHSEFNLTKKRQIVQKTSPQCFFANSFIPKSYNSIASETMKAETFQSSTQQYILTTSQKIQTDSNSSNSQAQTTSISTEESLTQTEEFLSVVSSQTIQIKNLLQAQSQTDFFQLCDEQTQTNILNLIQTQAQTQGFIPQFRIFHEMDIKISLQSQQTELDFVKIPSFCTKTQQKNSSFIVQARCSSSKVNPSTLASASNTNKIQMNPHIHSSANNQEFIYENHCFQIDDEPSDIIYRNRSNYDSYSQKSINTPQQNLSTKNDDVVQTKLDHDLLVKYWNLQQKNNRQQEGQKSQQQNSESTPHFTEQNIRTESGSLLNNAVLLSQNSLKEDGKTFNPETKSYRTRRINASDISISPWFLDELKETKQQSLTKTIRIPTEISSQVNNSSLLYLQKYLSKRKLSLSFEQRKGKGEFQKPKTLKKRIHFLFVKGDKQNEVFMINSERILSLNTNKSIKFESNSRIDSSNFMFGQSEVVVTGDRRLLICRNGKNKRLQGDLEDGIWQIQSIITCIYHRSK